MTIEIDLNKKVIVFVSEKKEVKKGLYCSWMTDPVDEAESKLKKAAWQFVTSHPEVQLICASSGVLPSANHILPFEFYLDSSLFSGGRDFTAGTESALRYERYLEHQMYNFVDSPKKEDLTSWLSEWEKKLDLDNLQRTDFCSKTNRRQKFSELMPQIMIWRREAEEKFNYLHAKNGIAIFAAPGRSQRFYSQLQTAGELEIAKQIGIKGVSIATRVLNLAAEEEWQKIAEGCFRILYDEGSAKELLFNPTQRQLYFEKILSEQEQWLWSRAKIDEICAVSPEDFERIVGSVFKSMGYLISYTPISGDEGIDIICEKEKTKLAIQCKQQKKPVGQPVIRDFFGAMQHIRATKGCVVTSSIFSTQAEAFAEGKNIELIDGMKLIELVATIKSHHENL